MGHPRWCALGPAWRTYIGKNADKVPGGKSAMIGETPHPPFHVKRGSFEKQEFDESKFEVITLVSKSRFQDEEFRFEVG